jgi:hypothetical protein
MKVTSSQSCENMVALRKMRVRNTLEIKQEVVNERNWSIANDDWHSPDVVFLELFQKRKQDALFVLGARQVSDSGAIAA